MNDYIFSSSTSIVNLAVTHSHGLLHILSKNGEYQFDNNLSNCGDYTLHKQCDLPCHQLSNEK